MDMKWNLFLMLVIIGRGVLEKIGNKRERQASTSAQTKPPLVVVVCHTGTDLLKMDRKPCKWDNGLKHSCWEFSVITVINALHVHAWKLTLPRLALFLSQVCSFWSSIATNCESLWWMECIKPSTEKKELPPLVTIYDVDFDFLIW